MTRKGIVLWIIALVGLTAGGVLLRLSDGVRAKTIVANAALAATQREATRIGAGPPNPMPLSMQFTARGLAPTMSADKVSVERVSANEVFGALIDYERKGAGALSQFAFAFPEPGRASGSATPLARPALPAAPK
jgi:hypothetical protein